MRPVAIPTRSWADGLRWSVAILTGIESSVGIGRSRGVTFTGSTSVGGGTGQRRRPRRNRGVLSSLAAKVTLEHHLGMTCGPVAEAISVSRC